MGAKMLERAGLDSESGRIKIIACATVIEEMLPHLPKGVEPQVLDFGLHVNPKELKHILQETIDAMASQADTILLGYGLCSQAVVGLPANDCTLLVPKVDDCIAIYLGSGVAYRAQFRAAPGTYYLTKGWIEAGDSPFAEYDSLVEQYGEKKAQWLMSQMLKNYTRLALINTGQYELERYRTYARHTAERWGLRYEEIPGSGALITRLLHGPWDGDFVIARTALAQKDPAQAERLQELVVESLNQAAAEVCAEASGAPAPIVESVVVGNTAMQPLFLRLPVEQLARVPYVPAVVSALDIKARNLGLRFAPAATVHLLPNIAGYVGADHVAMLLAPGVAQSEGVVLAIDIGTNTEVCLANHGTLTSLSCASGPAFEGAHIRHGMRATPRAIEHLRLVGDHIEHQIVGGGPPAGLCGSGILDALAQLYLAGVVSRSGRMGEHPRMRGEGGEWEFVLVGEDERGNGRPSP